MRLHLLLLLSVVYLAPALCQRGGFRIGRSAEPTAFEVLQKQTEAATTAIRNKDVDLLISLVSKNIAKKLATGIHEDLATMSLKAVSANYVDGEVRGVMLVSDVSQRTENIECHLIKDAGSPTGWIFVKVVVDATFHSG